MLSELPIGDRILEVVRTNPDCSLDEVVQQLPDLLWSDVFMEVDRLNRLGRLRLTQDISLELRAYTFRKPVTARRPDQQRYECQLARSVCNRTSREMLHANGFTQYPSSRDPFCQQHSLQPSPPSFTAGGMNSMVRRPQIGDSVNTSWRCP